MQTKHKKIIAAVCAALAVTTAAAAGLGFALTKKGPFTGTVKAADGTALAGVSVTDGRHVTKTDDAGCFTLHGWRKSHFVTVTVPAGYQTDRYYLPVDKDSESYDFVLDASSVCAEDGFCFMQIADTEIGGDGAGDWLENLKELIRERQPAFLMHTGDICYEAGLKKHIEQMNTETMGCTVRYTIGNHDYVQGDFGEQLFESLYGPVWYSFEVGNIHFAVTSFQRGSDVRSCYGNNDRWRWLKNDLDNTDSEKKMQIAITS